MQEHNKATEWFEDIYKKHKENHHNIPWARGDVNPLLRTYLEDKTQHHKGRALVIGCGLGDDAHALCEAGYEVLAIDISETALAIAKERSRDLPIVYEKQDIFDMPQKYDGYFDFVFEALTIQSLPVKFRERMIEAVAKTLAPQGRLLVVAHQKSREFDGPPWPLTKEQIDMFKNHGLRELFFEIHTEASNISDTRFRVLYEKMEAVEIEQKLLYGIKERTKNSNEMNPKSSKIAPLWKKFDTKVDVDYINGQRVYGVYTNYESDFKGEFDVYAAYDGEDVESADLEQINIKAGRYLLFKEYALGTDESARVEAVLKAWGRVWEYFSEDNAQYKRAYNTDFEFYKDATTVELYISIK